jgi:hypothetical protein
MKKLRLLLPLLALHWLASTSLFGADASVPAKVLQITGPNAMVKLSANDQPRPLTQGESLAQGATIQTGKDTTVVVVPMSGAVATIKPETEVVLETLSKSDEGTTAKKRNTVLNLKSGNLVSSIDPSKKETTEYKVNTLRGVAAARGTNFSVTIRGAVYLVAVTAGQVNVIPQGSSIAIPVVGGQSSAGGEAASLGSPPAGVSAADMQNAVAAAVSAVAEIAASPTLQAQAGISSSDAAGLVNSAVTSVVNSMSPAAAQNVVAQAAAAAASVPQTGGQVSNSSAALTSIVEAAVTAVAAKGGDVSAGVQNLVQAAAQGAASTAQSPAQANSAAATIANAAGKAAATNNVASTTGNAIAQAVASGTASGVAANTNTSVSSQATVITTTVTNAVANNVQQGAQSGGATITVATPPPPSSTSTPPPVITTPPVDPSVNVSGSS